MAWLQEVLDATDESESPKQFYYWSALTAIAAVVKNNVWLERHYYTLFPNIYVILVARSGLKKSVAVAFAQDLVKRVGNTRVIGGRSSIQGIIKELATVGHLENGTVLNDSCGYIVSGEFAASLVDDSAALNILTTLYDGNYNPEWKNMLKGSGTEVLKDINVTLLGASNEAHLKEVIREKDIKGGFIARTFMVHADKRNRINSLVYKPAHVPDREKLADYLRQLSKVKGPIEWTNEAGSYYDKWYSNFASQVHEDETGTQERISDSILKVAILLHLARDFRTLRLDKQDIEEALEACSPFVKSANKVTLGQGKNNLGLQTAKILQDLIALKRMSRRQILVKHWADIDASALDSIIDTLTQQGAITRMIELGQVYYEIEPWVIERFTTIKKEAVN